MSILKLLQRRTEDQSAQGCVWKKAAAFQGSWKWEDQKQSKASESSEVQLQGVYPFCQRELHAQGALVANSKRPAHGKINNLQENVRGEHSGLAGIAWLVCSRTSF